MSKNHITEDLHIANCDARLPCKLSATVNSMKASSLCTTG